MRQKKFNELTYTKVIVDASTHENKATQRIKTSLSVVVISNYEDSLGVNAPIPTCQ